MLDQFNLRMKNKIQQDEKLELKKPFIRMIIMYGNSIITMMMIISVIVIA